MHPAAFITRMSLVCCPETFSFRFSTSSSGGGGGSTGGSSTSGGGSTGGSHSSSGVVVIAVKTPKSLCITKVSFESRCFTNIVQQLLNNYDFFMMHWPVT